MELKNSDIVIIELLVGKRYNSCLETRLQKNLFFVRVASVVRAVQAEVMFVRFIFHPNFEYHLIHIICFMLNSESLSRFEVQRGTAVPVKLYFLLCCPLFNNFFTKCHASVASELSNHFVFSFSFNDIDYFCKRYRIRSQGLNRRYFLLSRKLIKSHE